MRLATWVVLGVQRSDRLWGHHAFKTFVVIIDTVKEDRGAEPMFKSSRTRREIAAQAHPDQNEIIAIDIRPG